MAMVILGINAYHGDASAAIVVDGALVAAVEEERFTRVKHTAGFPAHAVRYCLQAAGVTIREVDHIAIPRNPRARLVQKLLYAVKLPKFALERVRVLGRFGRIKEALAQALEVDPKAIKATFHRVEHHLAHLASSFFVSPFERAAVLSLDGLGDFASGMWGIGEGNRITVWGSVPFPHSVGMYYTAVTQFLGFWKYGDEYKVMGLSAYGEPEFLEEFRQMLRVNDGMGYEMDLRYFRHHTDGPTMTWEAGEPQLGQLFSDAFVRRFGDPHPPRTPVGRREENLAASLQARLEEVVLHQINALYRLVYEHSYPSPFMLLAYKVRPEKRDEIPAPTHVDGTGRLQTVSQKTNPLYWQLIDAFRQLTSVPVVLNTSFNENEPIVCTPDEAIDCFLRTHMDVLAIGSFLVERA
jgi:carbamoyltransferase